MNHLLRILAIGITRFIDFFYKPFARWCTPEFFRYGACGAGNMMFDWVLYFIIYNFVLRHQMLYLGFVTISSHVATLIFVYPITLCSGFFLAKYVTFTSSNLHSSIQALRYVLISILNLIINYFGMKLFVDALHIYPTPSKILVTIVAVCISYFGQKHFTFVKNNKNFF